MSSAAVFTRFSAPRHALKLLPCPRRNRVGPLKSGIATMIIRYRSDGIVPAQFQGDAMSPLKIVGIVLIVAGVAAMATGGFSFTKETHKAEIGPLKFSVQEKESVNVPLWAGIGAIAAGVVLLVVGGKK